MDPFIRTKWLLGAGGVERLNQSKIAVFGLGGVGSYAVEALARTGVGHFVLVDADFVEISNFNRQLHATIETLGRLKVDVMRERILSINPKADVQAKAQFFQSGDPDGLISRDLDYIVDAIDTVPSKIGLIVKAKELCIPVISCMGTGNKLDPTRFEVADISETSVCPLCKVMRRSLRRLGIQHVKVVYSREPPLLPQRDTDDQKSPGSVAFVPSVAGLMMASEVVKDLIYPGKRKN